MTHAIGLPRHDNPSTRGCGGGFGELGPASAESPARGGEALKNEEGFRFRKVNRFMCNSLDRSPDLLSHK